MERLGLDPVALDAAPQLQARSDAVVEHSIRRQRRVGLTVDQLDDRFWN